MTNIETCPVCQGKLILEEPVAIKEQGTDEYETVYRFKCEDGHVSWIEKWSMTFNQESKEADPRVKSYEEITGKIAELKRQKALAFEKINVNIINNLSFCITTLEWVLNEPPKAKNTESNNWLRKQLDNASRNVKNFPKWMKVKYPEESEQDND